jgi:hypothetical protein
MNNLDIGASMEKNVSILADFLPYIPDEELKSVIKGYFPELSGQIGKGLPREEVNHLLLDYCVENKAIDNLLNILSNIYPIIFHEKFPDYKIPNVKIDFEKSERHKIFISYSFSDSDFVQKLSRNLEAHGWKTWIAQRDIHGGESWVDAIGRGLSECKVFMVILSPESVQSQWVRIETNSAIELAVKNKLKFIPITICNCDVPILWRGFQSVSFLETYEKGLKNLYETLEIKPPPKSIGETSKDDNHPSSGETSGKALSQKGVKKINFVSLIKITIADENLSSLIVIILIAFVTIILRFLIPGITGDYITISSALIVLLFILFLRSSHRSVKSKEKRYIFWGIGSVLLVSLLGIILFFISAFYEQRTIYFIVDVSSDMTGLLSEINPRISIDSSSLPDSVQIGLTVFGGNFRGGSDCEDAIQWVPPDKKSVNEAVLNNWLGAYSLLTPTGIGSLNNAITYSFSQLKNRKGIQQIIVLTSKIDHRCGELLDKEKIDALAKKYNIQTQITVFTVGDTDENDRLEYQRIADVYQPVKPEELSSKINAVIAIPPTVYNLVYP